MFHKDKNKKSEGLMTFGDNIVVYSHKKMKHIIKIIIITQKALM
jgi:hypothetical protein